MRQACSEYAVCSGRAAVTVPSALMTAACWGVFSTPEARWHLCTRLVCSQYGVCSGQSRCHALSALGVGARWSVMVTAGHAGDCTPISTIWLCTSCEGGYSVHGVVGAVSAAKVAFCSAGRATEERSSAGRSTICQLSAGLRRNQYTS